jgi:lysozyme family protein
MGDFERAYGFTRGVEGGFSDRKNDKGGQTKYGITTGTFRAAQGAGLINPSLRSVKDLSPDDAKRIYREWFWRSIRGEELPQDVATVLFDMAANSGVPKAVRTLQEVLKVAPDGKLGKDTLNAIKNYQGNLAGDFLGARPRRYDRIVKNDAKQQEFIKGWSRRVNDLRNFVDRGSPSTTNPASRQRTSVPPTGWTAPPSQVGPTRQPNLSPPRPRNALSEPPSASASMYGAAPFAPNPLPWSAYPYDTQIRPESQIVSPHTAFPSPRNALSEPFSSPASMYGANPFAPDPQSWPRNLLDAPLFTNVTEPKVPR